MKYKIIAYHQYEFERTVSPKGKLPVTFGRLLATPSVDSWKNTEDELTTDDLYKPTFKKFTSNLSDVDEKIDRLEIVKAVAQKAVNEVTYNDFVDLNSEFRPSYVKAVYSDLMQSRLFGDHKSIHELSNLNIDNLYKRLGYLSREEEIYLVEVQKNLVLSHGTNYASKVKQSDHMMSSELVKTVNDSVQDKRKKIVLKTTQRNLNIISYDGFIFYRISPKPQELDPNYFKNRYGESIFLMSPNQLKHQDFFVTLFDPTYPFKDYDGQIEFRGETLRSLSEDSNEEWSFQFDETGDKLSMSFSDTVFYGEDAFLGIALSSLVQLRAIRDINTENSKLFYDTYVGSYELPKSMFRPELKVPFLLDVSTHTLLNPYGNFQLTPKGEPFVLYDDYLKKIEDFIDSLQRKNNETEDVDLEVASKEIKKYMKSINKDGLKLRTKSTSLKNKLLEQGLDTKFLEATQARLTFLVDILKISLSKFETCSKKLNTNITVVNQYLNQLNDILNSIKK